MEHRSIQSKTAAYLLAVMFFVSCLSTISAGQQTKEAEEADNYAAAQTTEALNALPKSAQVVIGRLAAMGSLPVASWRLHIGDVAHGESTGIDDTTWSLIQAPYEAPTKDVVWIRTWIEVPTSLAGYNLSGASLRQRSLKDDTVTVYLDGQRVAAGEDLEPITLFSHVKAGDKALLAIRIGETDDDTQSIPALDLTVEANPARPDPQQLRTELVTAALLIPHLAGDRQKAYAALDKAASEVNCEALGAGDQSRFDQSLRDAQKDLESLRPMLQSATMWLVGNSHIDAAWLWPWTETVDVVKRTFSSALQLMDEYPTFVYTQSAVQYYEWIAEKYPLINDEIKRRIREGRWEVVGGMWVEPDLNMPSGESQVRQLLIGQRTLKKLYGVTATIGWNPDSFGYNWQLPQIYKRSGINYFVTQKLSWNETNPLPMKLFWWESPDGSKVLTYFPHRYGNEDLDPVRLSNDWVKAHSLTPGLLSMMDLYGVGDHGGGVTRSILDQGLGWMGAGSIAPAMRFGRVDNYFHDVEGKLSPNSAVWNYQTMAKGSTPLPDPPVGKISIPTWKDELYFEHHRGTYTTQAQQKKNMRESETWLLNAEEYSSLAWLDGEAYPGDLLNDAWKKVLFNQFHDLAAGSGVGTIYVDAQHDYDQVQRATKEAASEALHEIEARINTAESGVPILVFNPLGWERSGLVQVDVQMPQETNEVSILDARGRVLPSQILNREMKTSTYHLLVQVRDVPSVGYEILHAVAGKRSFASDLRASGTVMENGALRVTIDPHTGCISSLFEKKDHFEAIAAGACGNQIQMFKDTPEADDAWNIDPGTFDHVIPVTDVESARLVESSPLRSVIRVVRRWQNSQISQDIVLYAGADQVDVINDIDWHETHVLMKAAFPLAATSKMATYEIPFGTINRPTTRNNSWEKAKFEVPALRWADLGDGNRGLSLLNDSKYGYDCEGNVLRLTLLRSPVEPDPNADRGHHHFSYSLYPHAGDWKSAMTIRRGYESNNALQAMQVTSHAGELPSEHSFISLENGSVILSAVKKAEDGSAMILRFYEWKGDRGHVLIKLPSGAKSASLVNLMEQATGTNLPINKENEVEVPFNPYEIVTLRVDYSRDSE